MYPRLALPALGGLLGAMLWPAGPARAHIDLDWPVDRGCSDQKVGPCGSGCDARSNNVTVLPPGATITVQWTETVPHPGHYRIAFDDDGIDDFEDPTGYDDIQTDPALPVLLDGIEDREGTGPYQAQVTLPDVECERCTLQLIQVMTDKPPWDTNDVYYRCADLALRSGAPLPVDAGPIAGGVDAGPGSGADPPGGGCHSAGGGSLGASLLLLGAALLLRRSPAPAGRRVHRRLQ